MSLTNNIKYFDSKDLLNNFLFDKLADLAKSNNFHSIILSGGSSPVSLYKKLGESSLAFSNLQFVLSDDRRVPIDNPLSNEGMLNKTLGVAENFNLLSLHSNDIEQRLNSIHVYELAILGMGLDGHFASIFPEMTNLDKALTSLGATEMVDDGFPEVPRITMTLNEIDKAREIILLINGQEKLDLLLNLSKDSNLPIKYLIERTKDKLLITTSA
ncbi:MAG: 6-phosphogluconolactonase [Gammaproteobacteria bacterium]